MTGPPKTPLTPVEATAEVLDAQQARHAMAIIVAVLAFGGLWGVWGVFFAIPLATLVKAIYNSWPRQTEADDGVEDDDRVEDGDGVEAEIDEDEQGRAGNVDEGAVSESGV